MAIDKRLEELGIELPPIPAPAGNYVHSVRTGNLLYLAARVRSRGRERSVPRFRWRTPTDTRARSDSCSSR